MERSNSNSSRAEITEPAAAEPPARDSRQNSFFEMPAVSIGGGAHPKVLRALKLMRDIHWDTSGAVVGSSTEYTPIHIRNIDDIKRDARTSLLRTAKVGRSYHIGQINATSNFLRPNSASAKLVSEVCEQEEQRVRLQRRRLRKSKSQSMDRPPRQLEALEVSPVVPQGSGIHRPLSLSGSEAGNQSEDVFEDFGEADSPLSPAQRPASGSRRPLSGSRPAAEGAGGRGRPGSGRLPGRASPRPALHGAKHGHSFQEAKPAAAPTVTKSKSFDVRPKMTKEEKERAAMAKIEEKRLRVLQKQLDIERKNKQMMWLKIIAHFSRTGLLMKTLLKSRNSDFSLKMFCLSQGIILKILKWWRPVRINVWKKKNPKLVIILTNFFLRTKLRVNLTRVRESSAMISRFLRDVLNSGERYKKMKHFRSRVIKFQEYMRCFAEVQRNRILLMKMALDKMVLDQLNRLKKEKATHELNAVNKLKYRRDFGPTVIKIQKITLYTNQLLNASAALSGHGRRRRPQSSHADPHPSHADPHPSAEVGGGAEPHVSAPVSAPAAAPGAVGGSWYPGSSFSGFGVDAGGRPPNPKYTGKDILEDLKHVLTNQRRRHVLAAAEYEANVKANKGVSAVGLSRVKHFLKDKNDIGPMVEDTASYKVKRQYFLLLTLGGLSELEQMSAKIVQEYVDAEAGKITIDIT